MPLTPAEVHNVAFKKPPIGKRGYDEEEVDAFLDIVEVELARLIEENNDLRNRPPVGEAAPPNVIHGANPAELAAFRDENARLRDDNARLVARANEMEKAFSQQGQDGAGQAGQQIMALQQQLAQTEQQLTLARQQFDQAQQVARAAQQQAQQAQQAAQTAQQQAAAAAAAARPADAVMPSEAQNQRVMQVLSLAQQTAETHVAQAKAEADRLMSDAQSSSQSTVTQAQAQAQRHLSDAQTRAAQVVSEAEQRAGTITVQLEQSRDALERRLEQLRTFEREYRTRLKGYLESQLRDLEASGRADSANAVGADAMAGVPR
ncbi:MAG: DivIVA domain-containing protein [Actinomycetia bacterium]|nr:DivIVA domain-containing protein [Actinomycetes bacterium]